MRVQLRGWTLWTVLGLAVGCGEGRPPRGEAPAPPPPVPSLDALAALGYADHAVEAGDSGDGVALRDPERVAVGWNLAVSIPDRRAVLFDVEGRVRREWKSERVDSERRWTRAAWTRDGGILVIDSDAGLPAGVPGAATLSSALLRYSQDGALLWRSDLNVHHYLEELEDGRILTLLQEPRQVPEISRAAPILDNAIAVLSAEGALQEAWWVSDLVRSTPEVYHFERPELTPKGEGRGALDVFHCNAVTRAAEADRWLLTARNLNLVAQVDLRKRRLDWVWGPGVLQGPHEAVALPSGRVLVFDNGRWGRGYSRVLEFDPRTGEITWAYDPPEPERFYSPGRGQVQALSNGNVLVVASALGVAFELTRDLERVWEYANPFRDGEGRRSVLRLTRYEEPLGEAAAR